MKRIPRPLRPLCVVVGGWLALFLAVNLVVLLSGVAARWAGKDTRVHDDRWPDVTNLRVVRDRLLIGGETSPEQYRQLAKRGVTLVIDMRTGGGADVSTDDPEQLAVLGLDHAELPIPDGRAPTPAQIRRFLDLVATADGRVFAHCGGGVGRSTSIAATYEAAQGQDPSVLEQLATGPPTIEQIWFVATLRPNHPDHGISPAVAVASVWLTRHAGCTAGSSQSSDAPLQAHQGEEQGRGDYTLEVVALAGVRRGRGQHFYQRLG